METTIFGSGFRVIQGYIGVEGWPQRPNMAKNPLKF